MHKDSVAGLARFSSIAGIFSAVVGGLVSGLALATFAVGPIPRPSIEHDSWIASAQAAEPYAPVLIDRPQLGDAVEVAPPVRVARYGGRIVVCADCAAPVWRPQAAVPAYHSDPKMISEDAPSQDDDGVAVYVGSHSRPR